MGAKSSLCSGGSGESFKKIFKVMISLFCMRKRVLLKVEGMGLKAKHGFLSSAIERKGLCCCDM